VFRERPVRAAAVAVWSCSAGEMAPSFALDGPAGGYRNAPTSAPASPAAPGVPPPWVMPSGGVISVDEAVLGQAVTLFRLAAADAAGVAAKVPRPVVGSELGAAPWGDDPLGAAFGAQYADPAQQMGVALDELAGLLTGVADQLASVTGTFVAAEDRAVDLAAGLEGGIGGRY
jgi:hypothetical protein